MTVVANASLPWCTLVYMSGKSLNVRDSIRIALDQYVRHIDNMMPGEREVVERLATIHSECRLAQTSWEHALGLSYAERSHPYLVAVSKQRMMTQQDAMHFH